jgi:hypothetical protein
MMNARQPATTSNTARFDGGARLILFLCALGLCGIIGPGCRSADIPASTGFPSVEIHGNTPGQIHDVAVVVFCEKGYKLAKTALTKLVFEKEGSSWRNIAYGNWIGDTPIWIRVKASIVPVEEATFRLECHAFMLRGKGETTEEEIPISNFNSGHYQKLLDEVAERLGANQGR